jgi:hypothetical protein
MVSPVTSAIALPAWVSATQALQDNVFLSKTLLEVGGLDTTMYAMGRGPVEKNVIAFKLGLTTAMAGLFAPLHAGGFAWLAAKLHDGIDRRRLMLTYDELKSVQAMKAGLDRLEKEVIAKGKPLLALPAHLASDPELLRTQTLKAKTMLLALDLATESLFLLNVGWFKNWFTYKLTGKKQFAGEMNLVDAKDLDQLYDHKAAKAKPPWIKPETMRKALNVASVLTPFAIAFGLRKAFIQPENEQWAFSKIRQVGHLFNNHNKGYTLGIAPYAAAFVFLNLGEYNAARSDNERHEVLIKKTPLFLTFMFGDHLINQAFNTFWPPQGYELKETITETLRHTPDALKAKAAKRAAISYGAAFAIQTALVAGVIYATNTITRRRVKTQVAEMKQEQAPQPAPPPSPALSGAGTHRLPPKTITPLIVPGPQVLVPSLPTPLMVPTRSYPLPLPPTIIPFASSSWTGGVQSLNPPFFDAYTTVPSPLISQTTQQPLIIPPKVMTNG